MEDPVMLGLRGVAIGLALALVLGGIGLPRRARSALLPLLLCLVAYVLRSAPEARAWPAAVLLPLSVGALLFPVAFWWQVRNAFDDRVDAPWAVRAAAAVLVVAGLLGGSVGVPAAFAVDAALVVQKAVAAAFVGAGLWRLWRGRSEDLVWPRRVLRGWLLAYVGAHGMTVLAVELLLGGHRGPAWLEALNVGLIALALAAALAWLIGYRADAVELLFGRPPEAPPPPAPAPSVPDVSAEQRALECLERSMTVERAYRDPDLSLARLARRVGLPEYRLRELIHHRLGFRNFPAFVNEHRLREVEQRLADPASDRLPILTLALEAGFGSIGPFNRAFRERHGVTPSSFRNGRGAAISEPG